MDGTLTERVFAGRLAAQLRTGSADGVRLHWLGQAGFVIDIAGHRVVIDPYLSDTLAEKYRHTPRPHLRMMPPPVSIADLGPVDAVICTHAHTDHMDPGTLKPLLAAHPQARLIAPRAARQQALDRSGIAQERLDLMRAGETLPLFPTLSLTATRAAHETLETDAAGDNRFLGYMLLTDEVRIWHSGDCVPFAGLDDEIAALHPDIALLPVNGRRPDLSENGVPGNFHLDEAIAVARRAGCSHMVAHHYGLFDFNTIDPALIDAARRLDGRPTVHRAREAIAFEWTSL